jgi:parvulin-like peptidyl-prolyl isomerase
MYRYLEFRWPLIVVVLLGMGLGRPIIHGQQSTIDPSDRVAATIDDEVIRVSDVHRELRRALDDQELDAETRRLAMATTLQQLVNRRLIARWLERTGQGASDQDVDLALQRLERRLARTGQSLSDYCEQQDFDDTTFHRWLTFQVGWQKFLDRYLTEENLSKYFDQHRRDFDGTRLRVAHILLRIDQDADESLRQETVGRAAQIRAEIVDGKLGFSEAARKYSQSPTASDGGKLGLISRYETMPEAFSAAAFALEEGQISAPVVSPYGVHLIRCLGVEPGQQTWQRVRPQLEKAVRQYLFEWAADRERPRVKIHYSGVVAPLQPETHSARN